MHSRRIPLAAALLLAAVAPLPAEAQLKPKSSFKIPADPAKAFPAPENVAEPPAEAQRTSGGVAWIRLNDAAAAPERPGPTDVVSV